MSPVPASCCPAGTEPGPFTRGEEHVSAETAEVLNRFIESLSEGRTRVVDLTNKLSSSTPTLRLPEPVTNLIDFSIEEVAAFDDHAPFWRHNNIHTGEHTGTHFDAPRHWISNRDGDDVSQVPPGRLGGPALVLVISVKVSEVQ